MDPLSSIRNQDNVMPHLAESVVIVKVHNILSGLEASYLSTRHKVTSRVVA